MTKREDFQKNNGISFESSALNGLRGFAAVHVLIAHSFLHSSWSFQDTSADVSYSYVLNFYLPKSCFRI